MRGEGGGGGDERVRECSKKEQDKNRESDE